MWTTSTSSAASSSSTVSAARSAPSRSAAAREDSGRRADGGDHDSAGPADGPGVHGAHEAARRRCRHGRERSPDLLGIGVAGGHVSASPYFCRRPEEVNAQRSTSILMPVIGPDDVRGPLRAGLRLFVAFQQKSGVEQRHPCRRPRRAPLPEVRPVRPTPRRVRPLRDAALLLGVRLNWYRSVPLSCVERLEVALDGVPLDPERTTLELDGVRCPVGDLAAARRAVVARPRRRDASGSSSSDRAGRRAGTTVDLVIGTPDPLPGEPDGDAAVIVDRAPGEVSP